MRLCMKTRKKKHMPLAEVGSYMNSHAQMCLHESVGNELKSYSRFLSEQFPELAQRTLMFESEVGDELPVLEPVLETAARAPSRRRRESHSLPRRTQRHGLAKFMGRRNPLGGFYF